MSEAASHADFSMVRYAQCWEDADILVEALDIKPGDTVVSIASAGDNTLALLAQGPERVVALDLSPAQLACLELRVAAYRRLDHPGLLELIGSRPSSRRAELYATVRPLLTLDAAAFWDTQPELITLGAGAAGKFEHYFALFRTKLLPLIHSRRTIERLLESGDRQWREDFFEQRWNTRRWRAVFKVFFSRFVMGRLGRDPSFFRYVEGSVSDRIMARTRYAIVELDPAQNPYMHWILTGSHSAALPYALREEHFAAIRDNLDCLEWHRESLEEFLTREGNPRVDAFNLSDIFEYMSEDNTERLLSAVADVGSPGARVAYWNMLAPRSRPESLAEHLLPLADLSSDLFARDKAWFYSAFVVEEVAP